MAAHYQLLKLAQVQPGMILADKLLDLQGNLLLPRGTVLTAAMLVLMSRHEIDMLPISSGNVSEQDLAALRSEQQKRLAQLFRKNDPDDDGDWATRLLRDYVEDFHLEQMGAK